MKHRRRVHEPLFLRTRQLLDAILELERAALGRAAMRDDELDRQARPRVARALAGVVRDEACVEIVRDAAIQGVVGAAREIDEPRHRPRH